MWLRCLLILPLLAHMAVSPLAASTVGGQIGSAVANGLALSSRPHAESTVGGQVGSAVAQEMSSVNAEPTVKVVPTVQRVLIHGGQVRVEVIATDFSDLAAFQVELTYDPAIVQVVAVTLTSFLGQSGRALFPLGPIIDNSAGRVAFGAFTYGASAAVSGSGTLATITFELQSLGATALHLQKVQVASSTAAPIEAATQQGELIVVGCLGDADADGDVDVFDLQGVSNRWHCAAGDDCYDPWFDSNLDGEIDALDLQVFAAEWSQACPLP